MAKNMPFDDDTMALFMGIGGPDDPGQHGRTAAPVPTQDAVSLVTEIRDMCDDWLRKAGKEDSEDEEDIEVEETDMEEE